MKLQWSKNQVYFKRPADLKPVLQSCFQNPLLKFINSNWIIELMEELKNFLKLWSFNTVSQCSWVAYDFKQWQLHALSQWSPRSTAMRTFTKLFKCFDLSQIKSRFIFGKSMLYLDCFNFNLHLWSSNTSHCKITKEYDPRNSVILGFT